MDWQYIGLSVLGILAILFSVKWALAVRALKEIGEAFTKTADALEDKKLTKQEALDLLKEWMDVIASIRALVGK